MYGSLPPDTFEITEPSLAPLQDKSFLSKVKLIDSGLVIVAVFSVKQPLASVTFRVNLPSGIFTKFWLVVELLQAYLYGGVPPEILAKILPSLFYQGLGDTNLLHFTVFGISPKNLGASGARYLCEKSPC